MTFIDCGFRVVGAGSIIRSLAEKNKIAKERLAFSLNNTASPVIELIPFATTFVGFNIANIGQGLKTAGVAKSYSAYNIWLAAIPYEFFSIVLIIITFSTIFFQWKKQSPNSTNTTSQPNQNKSHMMDMNKSDQKSEITPRLINLIIPMALLISLSIYFFINIKSSPNKAMLIALFISMFATVSLYLIQKYPLTKMTADIISGGNELMNIIAILVLAWALGSVSQELHLSNFVAQQLGSTLPGWSIPVTLFLLAASVTYFIGSGRAMASLIIPFAISLVVNVGVGIPICVAAVITGGTFGDVTSPLAGMTNMSSHVAGADQIKYLKYAAPYNFTALVVAALLFLIFA
jgi:tetracycline resistance efflux pump